VVCSYNEWDPLEEVIVGVLDGWYHPAWEVPFYGGMKPDEYDEAREKAFERAGRPRRIPEQAQRELDELVHVLEAEGVVVRRPDPLDHGGAFGTPDWSVPCGEAQSCPRDLLIVIGDEIIEAAMSYRHRYFEVRAYRRLIREYFERGARWTAAPKPLLTNDLYDNLYDVRPRKAGVWTTNELEPVFDAADIARCGRDLFVQRSHVTNESGIAWLERHLAPTYSVHRVEFDDPKAVHIDATWVPVAPGRVLVNPDRPIRQPPDCLRKSGWEFLEAPRRVGPIAPGTRWLSMNVLMLDERRMIVEREEEPFIRAAKDWGFEPIPVSFRNVFPFGGGFHCFTCDIRRRGTLQSYL
jgi:glycine amidinotransferase